MCGDILGVLLTSSVSRPGMLLHILKCPGQASQQRISHWPQGQGRQRCAGWLTLVHTNSLDSGPHGGPGNLLPCHLSSRTPRQGSFSVSLTYL